MKSIKHLILFCLVISCPKYIRADNSSSIWDFLIGLFVENHETNTNNHPVTPPHNPSSSSGYNVDYSKVRQQFRSAFDTAFSTSNHSSSDQKEIAKLREDLSNSAIQRLQTEFSNLSENAAKLKARELAQEYAVDAVGIMTEQFVNAEISRIRNCPPFNPEHLQPVDRDYLVKRLKQEMKKEAKSYLSDRNGALSQFAGKPLRDKITPLVEYQFGIYQKPSNTYQDPYAQLPAHQQPSAPPANNPAVNFQEHTDGIKEIYLQVTGDRNKEYFNKIQSKVGLFRTDECPVCQEEFKKIGKRVTLFCGHDACPKCLNNWLHVQNKNTCIICRSKIDKTELSSSYLHQNI